VRERKRS